jgi:hypothetical protein
VVIETDRHFNFLQPAAHPYNPAHARPVCNTVTLPLQCDCGAVEMRITGEPIVQYVCHCDDCQSVHGKPFSCALYPGPAVSVERGETDTFTLKTSPRTRCKQCRTYLFAEVPGFGVRGVNADLFPKGLFRPEFHIQCRYATAPIGDDLPHYKGTPARFKGSDELMEW